MDDLAKRVCIDRIMFHACSIGGCGLPQTEAFAAYIAEDIEKFITTFGFEKLTEEEFLFALLLNSYGKIKNPCGDDLDDVQFVGNCINVKYLGQIFKNYKVLRDNLDNRLRNLLKGY